MIYKGYKIEAEVSEFVTYEVNDDGTINYDKVTSEDGNDHTGYYICNTETGGHDLEEEWLTLNTIEEVKLYIDKLIENKG